MKLEMLCGDSRQVLRELPDNSIDGIVCDPPYHLTSISKRYSSPSAKAPRPTNGGQKYASMARGFMGKAWDGGDVAFQTEIWEQCLRVLKPGGHLLAFGGTRTYHRLACAVEDAGFEIRDQINWIYGQGFAKSLNIAKAIDKEAGVERKVVGDQVLWGSNASGGRGGQYANDYVATAADGSKKIIPLTVATSDAAQQWDGWHTALKPAHEPIVVARKPVERNCSVAENVQRWGTGGINVGACRVGEADTRRPKDTMSSKGIPGGGFGNATMVRTRVEGETCGSAAGRWPANVIHDGTEEVLAHFPQTKTGKCPADAAGIFGSSLTRRTDEVAANGGDEGSAARYFKECPPDEPAGRWPANVIHDGSEEVVAHFPSPHGAGAARAAYIAPDAHATSMFGNRPDHPASARLGDSGSAARFFMECRDDDDDALFSFPPTPTPQVSFHYCAKTAKSERELGQPATDGKRANDHPTVKPIALMRYLCRLILPPGGTVLDPFAGSGSTLCAAKREGFNGIGIELDAGYFEIAKRRIAAA